MYIPITLFVLKLSANSLIGLKVCKLLGTRPKKIKITAIRMGKNIINDLILLASFFVSARAKALSDQITITTNIANNINFI